MSFVGVRDPMAMSSGAATCQSLSHTFTAERDGVAYYFASEETMKRFKTDPGQYLPQFSLRRQDWLNGNLWYFLDSYHGR